MTTAVLFDLSTVQVVASTSFPSTKPNSVITIEMGRIFLQGAENLEMSTLPYQLTEPYTIQVYL